MRQAAAHGRVSALVTRLLVACALTLALLVGGGAAAGAATPESGFSGCKLSATSVASGVWTAVPIAAEIEVDSDGWAPVLDSVLGVPAGKPGRWYQFRAHVSFAANGTGYRQLALRVNDTRLFQTAAVGTASGTEVLTIAGPVWLQGSDFVWIEVKQTSGGSLDLYGSSTVIGSQCAVFAAFGGGDATVTEATGHELVNVVTLGLGLGVFLLSVMVVLAAWRK